MIQKLVQLKVNMDSACAVCNEITTNIAKGGSWEPLGHKTLLGKLRVARDAIEAVKVKNKFWKAWAMGGSTLATVLKSFDEKTLRKQLSEVEDLDTKLSTLVAKNESMKKMHSGILSSDEE